MVEPTGYTALDLVGFTDKGTYSSSASYVKNDLVDYGGDKWQCMDDDVSNVTPTEGAYWHKWIDMPNVSGKADISAIAPEEAGSTSSRAYAVGEHFYKNGKFCTAKAAIAQGATFTLNTNYVEGTIADSITDKLVYETGHNNETVSTKLTSLRTAFLGLSEAQRRKAYIALEDGVNPTIQFFLNTNSVGVFLGCGNSGTSLLRMDVIRIIENENPIWVDYTLQTTGITINNRTYSTTFSFQLWVSGK